MTPFFENFSKEIHRIANFGSVSYRGPHQNHLFLPSVPYRAFLIAPLYFAILKRKNNYEKQFFSNSASNSQFSPRKLAKHSQANDPISLTQVPLFSQIFPSEHSLISALQQNSKKSLEIPPTHNPPI